MLHVEHNAVEFLVDGGDDCFSLTEDEFLRYVQFEAFTIKAQKDITITPCLSGTFDLATPGTKQNLLLIKLVSTSVFMQSLEHCVYFYSARISGLIFLIIMFEKWLSFVLLVVRRLHLKQVAKYRFLLCSETSTILFVKSLFI